MRALKKLLAVLLGGAVSLAGLTCAPVDPLPPAAEKSAGAEPPQVARLFEPAGGGDNLRARVEAAIDQARQRDLLTTHGFWTVFHGILGLGPSIQLVHPRTGLKFNAVEYIASGGEVRGLEFIPVPDGLDVQTGPEFVGQGHQDQFVAEMAQWGMPSDRKFVVRGKDYTFMDFIRHTKARARVTASQELGWAILVLGQYLGTDLSWTNSFGEKLHFEDLVRYELKASMDDAACGGTHRLFGLAWVHHLHLHRGGKTTGVWQELADQQKAHVELARKYQNPDGAFSTNFFRGPGNDGDRQLRMNTTGHILEWLALTLPDEELNKPWVQQAVNALALMFLEIQSASMEGGTLYHAVHGLLNYYARVYGADKLGPHTPLLPLPGGRLIGKLPG